MDWIAIVCMIIIGVIVWGGFIFTLRLAIKKEAEKLSGKNI
ncbi:MAG: MetS family NSS transporter small subunit [Calditrichaeota bacterium]|nr:MAG: MetS family NSS transporter small subunit [Calditrichota bacterium]